MRKVEQGLEVGLTNNNARPVCRVVKWKKVEHVAKTENGNAQKCECFRTFDFVPM